MDARRLISKLVPASPRLPSGRRRVGKRLALKPAAELALTLFAEYRALRAAAPTRLHTPSQVRTSTGQEVTASTVSMAIGMLDNNLIFSESVPESERHLLRIGRDVFIASWWGDSAFRVDHADLRLRIFTCLVLPEHVAREERVFRLSAEAARQQVALSISTRYGSHSSAQAARAKLEAATDERWPSVSAPERYYRLIGAVLTEMAGTSICPDCRGSGHVFERIEGESAPIGRLVPCSRCQGSGWINAAQRQRARACKLDHKVYRRDNWGAVYGWLIKRLRTLERNYRERIGEIWD